MTANDVLHTGAWVAALGAMVCAVGWVRDRRRWRRTDRMVLVLAARLNELRAYVERDRSIERRERQRFVRQLDAARAVVDEHQTLLRQHLMCQAMLDSDRVQSATSAAREVLTSGFGEL